MARGLWCPACRNGNPELMDDNGLPTTDPDYALLCKAPTGLIGDVDPDDPDGLSICGMQWEPNKE